jgi:hypothetical protein
VYTYIRRLRICYYMAYLYSHVPTVGLSVQPFSYRGCMKKLLKHGGDKLPRRQTNTCRKVPLQVIFLDDDIFALLSISLIFIRFILSSASHFMGTIGVRSTKFVWVPVYSCTHWLKPRNLPSPAFGLICEGAIGQLR